MTRIVASLLALLTVGVLALPQPAAAQAPDDRAAWFIAGTAALIFTRSR